MSSGSLEYSRAEKLKAWRNLGNLRTRECGKGTMERRDVGVRQLWRKEKPTYVFFGGSILKPVQEVTDFLNLKICFSPTIFLSESSGSTDKLEWVLHVGEPVLSVAFCECPVFYFRESSSNLSGQMIASPTAVGCLKIMNWTVWGFVSNGGRFGLVSCCSVKKQPLFR
ncbi:hypothetical protein HNY73_001945 [Argiope bruennichi]|uniref:Uncharacterized protein n=1 Tax=Argiope bruennichi TaxID=94029 RepID=A0A8T0FT29_ARGBR|nr:hypothetical protein HNY73_001945 [Argiope bruennichi]